MWFWQLKKPDQLWLSTAGISIVAHAVILFFLFFHHDRSTHLSFVINAAVRREKPLEFSFALLPKSQPQLQLTKSSGKSGGGATIASQTSTKMKTVQTPAKKKTQALQNQAAKVPVKKEVQKKVEPIKTEPVKPVPPSKNESPQPLLPTNKQEQKTESASSNAAPLGKHEQELIEEFYVLRDNIMQTWRPPRGFPVDCGCEVSMRIGWDGAIQECTIEKSSGVLIYDSSAQAALYTVAMPRWTWGKTITIAFNQ